MPCDLCGDSKADYVCSVEGSEVTVCSRCSKYGEVVRRLESEQHTARKQFAPIEKVEEIVPNYGQVIRQKRESLGMNQEDFAKKITERLSILHKLESNRMKPDFEMARKLERLLHIKLIAQVQSSDVNLGKKESESLTIGDILSVT